MEKYMCVAGTDFDFPTSEIHNGTAKLDVLEKLQNLSKFLPSAQSAELMWIGGLETKDATRIRLKIVYPESGQTYRDKIKAG